MGRPKGATKAGTTASLSVRVSVESKANFFALVPKAERSRLVEAWIADGCPVSDKPDEQRTLPKV